MRVIRRPQRVLTEAELEVIRDLPLLCLHRALYQGLVDPAPNPSPMSEEDGAWVREHAWLPHHHEIENGYPFGWHRYGYCEKGTCWNCFNNRCDLCVHRQQGGPNRDSGIGWVYNHRGHAIAQFLRLEPGAECVWWCRCPCPKTGPPPTKGLPPAPDAAPVPRNRKQPGRGVLLPEPLFEVGA